MQDSSWSQAATELVAGVAQAFVRFWKQDMVQVALTVGMFLALALPMVLVVLILWYLDVSGWRPPRGFYTIGMLNDPHAWDARAVLASLLALRNGA